VARVRARQAESSGVAAWSRSRVLSAASEFTRPLLGASLATIVIHIPPVFLSGVTGEFFKALSLTIAVSLIVSYFVSWGVVPLLASVLLSERDARVPDAGPIFRAYSWVYARVLGALLRVPWLVAVPVVALVLASWWVYPHLKSGFMPVMD